MQEFCVEADALKGSISQAYRPAKVTISPETRFASFQIVLFLQMFAFLSCSKFCGRLVIHGVAPDFSQFRSCQCKYVSHPSAINLVLNGFPTAMKKPRTLRNTERMMTIALIVLVRICTEVVLWHDDI